MIIPANNFGKMSQEELSEYLFDAFERHSTRDCAGLSEMDHADRMKKSIGPVLCAHNANKAVSQEMWAVAILIDQFKRSAETGRRVPDALIPFGETIYNNPVFRETFVAVRTYLSAPELLRA